VAHVGAGQHAPVMTIGALSRRTGMSLKALRHFADIGLVYTAGRSPAGYRLFDESALWCVEVICSLRGLGLTVKEIRELAAVYLGQPDRPIGQRLAARLRAARRRIDGRIVELENLRRRLDAFEARYQAELAELPGADFRADDPRLHGAQP
jgi:MerR family transcriptional regulator, copper efflux regulator